MIFWFLVYDHLNVLMLFGVSVCLTAWKIDCLFFMFRNKHIAEEKKREEEDVTS